MQIRAVQLTTNNVSDSQVLGDLLDQIPQGEQAEKGPIPSNFAADKTDYPRKIYENALVHKLPDEVEAADLRGAYFEKRKGLMADWAEFCNE